MPEKTSIETILESVLFFKGGAMSVAQLAKTAGLSEEEVEQAARALSGALRGRGIRLVREKHMLALATAPEAQELIEKMRREELEGPLGKAGLETLAIIVFRGPISRTDIEYVRGVNCSSILRSLLIRGLIERVENPKDKRSFLYLGTAELPAYLGLSSLTEIPGYEEMKSNIEKIFAEQETAKPKTSPETALY